MLLLDFIVSSCPSGQNSPWDFLPYLVMDLCPEAPFLYRSFNSMNQLGGS